MPYFIYKISPPRLLEHLATLENYQEARAKVRALRQGGGATGIEFRMLFAQQQGEAERLLATPRDERVIGED